jgi:DNA-binding transcriptional LysR family regulator
MHRHLKHFITLAEELHFGRAAERMYMSQQPFSRIIQQLEQELGVQLFERTTRRVTLTLAGEIFLEEARQLQTSWDNALRRIQKAAKGEIGRLRIGYTATALYTVLPKAMKEFRSHYPEVQLELLEQSSKSLEQALIKQEIDVAFLYPPVNDSSLQTRIIISEPWMIVLPRDHRFSKDKKVSLKSLANEDFIIFPSHINPPLRAQIFSMCQRAGFTPKVVQEVFPEQTIISMVAAGMGLAFVMPNLQHLQRPDVVYKHLTGNIPNVRFGISWHKENRSAILKAFLVTAK